MALNFGLLLLRIWIGGTMALAHGWPKLVSYSQKAETFPDPLGVGSHVSLGLVVFAELICGVLVVLGLFSRLALAPFVVTMIVAFFIIHGSDPFIKRELAWMYLGGGLALFFTGPGKLSFQSLFKIHSLHKSRLISWLLQ